MSKYSHPEIIAALRRSIEMMQATIDFVRDNPITRDFTTTFDNAECDGSCLSDDCQNAIEEAEIAIERAQEL